MFFGVATRYHEAKIPIIFNSQVANRSSSPYAGGHEFVAF